MGQTVILDGEARPIPDLRKPFHLSGFPVPMVEGGHRNAKAVYVDQAAGSDASTGRTWQTAKATMFGASGAASVMADGDVVIFRAGHSEALAGPVAFARSFTKWLVEGPASIGLVAIGAAAVQFTGPELLTVSGQWNELVHIGANFIVAGNENRLVECTQGGGVSPSINVSGSRNRVERCRARLFVSGDFNIVEELMDGSPNLTGTATGNLFLFPRNFTLGADPFPIGALCANNLILMERGTGYSVADAGSGNRVWWVGDVPAPGGAGTEAVAPEVPAAAVVVTGGAPAGVYGATVPVLAAAAAPVSDYEFLGIVAVLNMVDDYHIEVQDTTGLVLGAFTANAAAVATRFSEKVLSPVRVRGGVGIQARLKTTGGGGDTAGVRVKFRTV